MGSKIALGLLGVTCLGVVWLVSMLHHILRHLYDQAPELNGYEYSWFFRLLLNMVGYSTVLLPMLIAYKYLHRTNYFDKITTQTGAAYRALWACFGAPEERLAEAPRRREDESGALGEGAELAFCFTGLMGAYLVWGLLQEKIMTQEYHLSDGKPARFKDSQFLVLVNRLAALLVAATRLLCSGEPLVSAPLYPFSYCSLTNVISAWCQYEALKYVSFPTQVLSKSCKVVPVMLMGKLVSRAQYELYEYVTALLISAGMVLFMLGSHDDNGAAAVATWASGASLLGLYMACDSFTSSWQGALLARRGCGPLRSLCAVNAFSVALAAASGPLPAASLAFLQSPAFVWDCLVLSASSTLGQLFIYRTIDRFGAVLFTIIMTLRQASSILLSCAVFGHRVSASGAAGVGLVFGAVLLRVYCRQRLRRRKAPGL